MGLTLTPGHTVPRMDGETVVWPTLAMAPLDTIVTDGEGNQWTRRRKWWTGPDGAQLTSRQLGERGPLTVYSVHVCEEWIDITTMSSPAVTSMCVSCGTTKETLR